jgi:lipopolysaccharide export system protein LptC
MLQNYKGFVALVILAVFSMWMLKRMPEVIEVKQLAKAEHDVDYFSVGYTKLQMDEFGVPSNKLIADYAVHYRDTSEVKLINPVNIIFKMLAPPWVVSSEEGVFADSGETLFLKGHVDIKRKAAEGGQQIDIQTRNLMVEPKKQFAETVEWAEMVMGQDTISGIGMKLFYESPMRIELLSKVRGLYVYK